MKYFSHITRHLYAFAQMHIFFFASAHKRSWRELEGFADWITVSFLTLGDTGQTKSKKNSEPTSCIPTFK